MGVGFRVIVSIYVFFLVLAAVNPDLCRIARVCRDISGPRACFANQKTLAGAIEMYSLDLDRRVTTLDAGTLGELVANGYLQSLPVDPGTGRRDTYVHLAGVGDGIFCLAHGAIRPKVHGVPARQQLVDLGVTDPALLARALAGPAPAVPRRSDPWPVVALQATVLVLVGGTIGVLALLVFAHAWLIEVLGPLGIMVLAAEAYLLGRWLRDRRARAAKPGAERPDLVRWERARCPVCASGFAGRVRVATCPRCRTPHHDDCLGWNGGCGVYACGPGAGPGVRAAAEAAKRAADVTSSRRPS